MTDYNETTITVTRGTKTGRRTIYTISGPSFTSVAIRARQVARELAARGEIVAEQDLLAGGGPRIGTDEDGVFQTTVCTLHERPSNRSPP